MIRLVSGPIDPAAFASAAAPTDGAVVRFEGLVRADSLSAPEDGAGAPPRRVTHLEYEAYEEMALAVLAEVADDALARHSVTDVRIVHRLGRVPVGEASVVIVVTAPHRTAAFEACRGVIDAIKERVPIWKKEIAEDGAAAWVAGTEVVPARAARPSTSRR
jgi:molybdopterin synthase catalytic subunit